MRAIHTIALLPVITVLCWGQEEGAPKNELAILRGTSRILEIRELTFVKQRQSSNSSRRIQSDSPQTHIGTLLASERRQKSTVK